MTDRKRICNERILPLLFGQNLEHTRSCIYGGLSAQLIRNRKFAGKPSRDGIAAEWQAFGKTAVYELLTESYTRHLGASAMPRRNELSSQCIQNLGSDTISGIQQSGLSLIADKYYLFRAAMRSFNCEPCRVVVRMTAGEKVLAEQNFNTESAEWKVVECQFGPFEEVDATISIGVKKMRTIIVGMVSLLPENHFHGMRSDVVTHLKEIGTSILRWPGGNFAGEYRWRDGLLSPDERAPLQSFTEDETQPYSHGYDFNELDTDAVVAICREIEAEPFFTINPVWDSPEESAAWVEYCNGPANSQMGKLRAERGFPEPYHVRFWSLGNEMGYGHMEGPHTPSEYEALSRRHAQAMLKVSPEITLFGSGPYPSREWAEGAAIPLADVAPMVSLHHYTHPEHQDFTTSERTENTIQTVISQADEILEKAREMRRLLPDNLSISFDEWNVWYSWYRQVGVAEGMFAARVLHQLLASYQQVGIGCVCYFQPINEGAIDVFPHSSRLTAVGQVMRLMSRHAHGLAKIWDHQPEEVFATEHENSTLVITLYNSSVKQLESFELPFTGTVTESELHSPSGLLPGSIFKISRLVPEMGDGIFRVSIPPLNILALRFQMS